ncbi:MAG: polysaccharide biosynthesis protein, partial [Thiohalomonadales bacterium]
MSLSQRLLRLPRSAKRAILISADSILLPVAFYMAYRLKTGDLLAIDQGLLLLIAVPLISVPIFIRTGLYRAVIRYMGAKAFYT